MIDLLSEFYFSSDSLNALNDILIFIRHMMTMFGSLVILTGSLFVVCQFLYRLIHSRHHQLLNFDLARLGLTRSIVLGLEFIIAADVIQTTTTPDYYAVGILAAVALIRAFLNYSLNKDLANLSQKEEEIKDQQTRQDGQTEKT
jgi:uncharacterized membrane protein